MPVYSNNKIVIDSNGDIVASIGNNSARPAGTKGKLLFNTDSQSMEIFDGLGWVPVSFTADGSTIAKAAPSGEYLFNLGIRQNGEYWIKPLSYSGDPFLVYVDFDGTASGITGGGGWMRVGYSQDYYSSSSPWTETGNADRLTGGAYTGDFSFTHSDAQISAMLFNASESRSVFEYYSIGSVGVTDYASGAGNYHGFKAFDNSLHRGNYTGEDNLVENGRNEAGTTVTLRPSSVTYGINTNINTFTGGADPATQNDNAVTNRTIIYWKDTSATYFPIRGAYATDVDGVGEKRWYPFTTGIGSYTWIK